MCGGKIRRLLQRLDDQIDSALRLATRAGDKAQHMQRIRVAGCAVQHPLIQCGCPVEITRAVKHDRRPQILLGACPFRMIIQGFGWSHLVRHGLYRVLTYRGDNQDRNPARSSCAFRWNRRQRACNVTATMVKPEAVS